MYAVNKSRQIQVHVYSSGPPFQVERPSWLKVFEITYKIVAGHNLLLWNWELNSVSCIYMWKYCLLFINLFIWYVRDVAHWFLGNILLRPTPEGMDMLGRITNTSGN